MLPCSNWNGLILHLYRQIDSSIYPAERLKSQAKGYGKTYTAFGNFDRLCFTPVFRFVDYMKRSGSAYQWIGGRKDIMLYPIEDPTSTNRHFSFLKTGSDYDPLELTLQNGTEPTHRRFLIMTMLYLSDKAKSMIGSYKVLLEKCQVQISNIVNKYNELSGFNKDNNVIFNMFGTFNSAEIGILWAADQFADVQYIVDQIRFLTLEIEDTAAKEALFTSAYTIVTLYDNTVYNYSEICSVRGGAMIQLASGANRNPTIVTDRNASLSYLSDLKEYAKNEAKNSGSDIIFEVDSCAGEYDFIIETRPPQLGLLSKITADEHGGLNSKKSDFSTYFSGTTTRLFYNDQLDISQAVLSFDWKTVLNIFVTKAEATTQLSPKWNEDRQLTVKSTTYNEYRNKLLNSTTTVSSLCTNVDLLFGDFIRAVNTTPDRQWAEDLHFQVTTAFDVLSKFCTPTDDDMFSIDRAYVESAEGVLQRLQQQIQHITETGKFSFEEPCLYAESTTEYDLLFHMYYGAVKDILSCIYDRSNGPSQAKQSRLVPLIQFEPTPIVRSTLYHDIDGLQDRLVDLTIPYDAWGDPNLYILYLIHELYHYAAPFNRNKRNEYFAKFFVSELAVNAIQVLVKREYEATEEVSVKGKKQRKSLTELKEIGQNEFKKAIARIASDLRSKLFPLVSNESITDHIVYSSKYSDTESDNCNKSTSTINNIIQGDVSWSTYYRGLDNWCGVIDGYKQSDSHNYLNFILPKIKQALLEVYRTCSSECLQTEDRSADRIILQELNHKHGVLRKPEQFVEAVRDVSTQWMWQICDQLRELYPDFAMAQLSGITASEYLLVFAILQEKLCTLPAFIKENDQALPLRMGYIIDRLVGCKDTCVENKMDAFETAVKNDFINLYTSYFSHCSWKDASSNQAAEKIRLTAAEKAENWFDTFKCKLGDFYSQYSIYQSLLDEIAQESYKPVCNSSNKYRLQKCASLFFAALRKNDAQELFKCNLLSIWEFQQQGFLSELSIQKETLPEQSTAFIEVHEWLLNNRRTDTLRMVTDSNDLQMELVSISQDLENIHRNVFGSNLPPNGLWYRGSQNSSFDILPSIMVHFLDDVNLKKSHAQQGENFEGALWQYQKSLLERFKYQADGAAEFLNSTAYTMPDYLAIMQHYQKYTCYLDWSEDAFSSLFFALEKYVMDEIDENYEHKHANVSLYILDPMLYNRARKMIVKKYMPTWSGFRSFSKSDIWIADQNMSLARDVDGYVPNLSAKNNPERFSMFTMDLPREFSFDCCGGKSYHSSNRSAKESTLIDILDEVVNLPLAVHTSRLNPRIRTQSGQFIAYSPFALPVYGPNEIDIYTDGKKMRAQRFSYLSLLKIQQFFLDVFPNEHPFMYELRIDHRCKSEVADFLRKAGIARYRIYPELTHLKL